MGSGQHQAPSRGRGGRDCLTFRWAAPRAAARTQPPGRRPAQQNPWRETPPPPARSARLGSRSAAGSPAAEHAARLGRPRCRPPGARRLARSQRMRRLQPRHAGTQARTGRPSPSRQQHAAVQGGGATGQPVAVAPRGCHSCHSNTSGRGAWLTAARQASRSVSAPARMSRVLGCSAALLLLVADASSANTSKPPSPCSAGQQAGRLAAGVFRSGSICMRAAAGGVGGGDSGDARAAHPPVSAHALRSAAPVQPLSCSAKTAAADKNWAAAVTSIRAGVRD